MRLPYYSASRQVVAELAQLPVLKEYRSCSFVEYQAPLGIGMDFGWRQGAFLALKRFTLTTSLANAAKVMASPHQPCLDGLTIISQDFQQHVHLRNLCSSLPASQSRLTILKLFVYSEALGRDPSQGIPFNLFRPLLQCTAIRVFTVRWDVAMAYDDEDIASMARAWPRLEELAFCADPASDVNLAVGQPLRSVGSFTQGFPMLQKLSIYLNTLDLDMEPGNAVHSPQPRLSVLDVGTSSIPFGSAAPSTTRSISLYLATLLQHQAELKSARGPNHARFIRRSEPDDAEYNRRATFWSSIAANIAMIQEATKHLAEDNSALRNRIRILTGSSDPKH